MGFLYIAAPRGRRIRDCARAVPSGAGHPRRSPMSHGGIDAAQPRARKTRRALSRFHLLAAW